MNKIYLPIAVTCGLALSACATSQDLSSCDPNVASYTRTLSGLTSDCYNARQAELAAIRADQDAEHAALEAEQRSILYETDVALLTKSERERELSRLAADILRLRADIPAIESVETSRVGQLHALKTELDLLTQRVDNLRARVDTADEDIERFRAELRAIFAEQDRIVREINALTEA